MSSTQAVLCCGNSLVTFVDTAFDICIASEKFTLGGYLDSRRTINFTTFMEGRTT